MIQRALQNSILRHGRRSHTNNRLLDSTMRYFNNAIEQYYPKNSNYFFQPRSRSSSRSSSSSRSKSSSSIQSNPDEPNDSHHNDTRTDKMKKSNIVWKAVEKGEGNENEISNYDYIYDHWTQSIHEPKKDGPMSLKLREAMDRIENQENTGGRMRNRQLGVLREDPAEDMRLLIQNFTVPALASALRDREEVLQLCATLLADNNLDELTKTLRPFERTYVERRRHKNYHMDLTKKPGLDVTALEMIRKGLMRMPRSVSAAHQYRAGVVLPLCDVNGVPSILFEKRSHKLRAHPDEVCLPGGMVCDTADQSIVATCLREMEEEIEGIDMDNVVVLGILRCNWGEVAQLTGVAVTPLVCYIGEVGDRILKPNPDEVSECFTVPLSIILEWDRWIHKENSAPIFTGGPHLIWGLTGYITDRFVQDVLKRFTIQLPS